MTIGDTTLATALAVIAVGLDDPSLDVQHGVTQLTAAVRAAVPSYCGLSITLIADGVPVTISIAHDDAEPAGTSRAPATSLVIPLAAISATVDGELVLFASAAGAFVDLAADLAYATATQLVTFELDSRLGSPVALSVGIHGFSVIHQAIGFLIGIGSTPEQARAHLAQVAAQDGHDLAAAAQHILKRAAR